MLSENEQSWIFLREFTREILNNIGNMYLRQELRKEIREKLGDILKNKDRIFEEIDATNYTPKLNVNVLNKEVVDNSVKVVEKPLVNQTDKSLEVVKKPILMLNIGKVNEIFNDEEVFSVECPGPNKFLIYKKPNKVDISPIVLSEEEIKKVISEFASLTKSYPNEGVFDSSYKNYAITAVMSDLAGSRFIITRYLDTIRLLEK